MLQAYNVSLLHSRGVDYVEGRLLNKQSTINTIKI